MESNCVKGKADCLYEVCIDELGQRIWINAADGSSVARFNVSKGVDIHNSVTDQMAGAPECLWCTHKKPDYQTWQQFILKVKELFGLTISIDAIDVGLLSN